VVKPEAAKLGLTTVEATTKCVENLVSDLGPVTNQVQQASLKFNSEHVTHVLTLTGAEGFFIGQFQQAADQQQYHPKYLFSSNGFPYNNSHTDGPVHWSSDDMPNMLGLGNLPYIDVGLDAKPADAAQAAAQAKCREADPQTGTQNASDDGGRAQATGGFYALCDLFLDAREVARVNGGRFDIASLVNGYRSVIDSRVSGYLTGGRHKLNGNRLEGAGYLQPMKFNPGTGRFVYFGSLQPVS
jgi:hypothetical protein